MMNDEKKLEDYLFDPSADPEGSVLEIERRLRTLRYDAAARPLPTLRMPRPRRFVRRAVQLLAAAAVLAMVIVGVSRWMWTWPAGRPWNVSGGDVATLSVGSRVHPPEPMLVRVARIGWMRVAGGSEVTLLSTRTGRHRLEMSQGRMHLRVWAPPGSVRIDTPSGEVIDLGCEFVLDVSRDTSRVEVLSGWVQLENSIDEVLVPAGATSEMRMHRAPTVPVYRDAPSGFRDAVRELESSAEATAAAALDRAMR
jgi:ferric-dicitrate binding protein FerR (iron transport regulator)